MFVWIVSGVNMGLDKSNHMTSDLMHLHRDAPDQDQVPCDDPTSLDQTSSGASDSKPIGDSEANV